VLYQGVKWKPLCPLPNVVLAMDLQNGFSFLSIAVKIIFYSYNFSHQDIEYSSDA